jgi:hypothetical protein
MPFRKAGNQFFYFVNFGQFPCSGSGFCRAAKSVRIRNRKTSFIKKDFVTKKLFILKLCCAEREDGREAEDPAAHPGHDEGR